MPVPPRFVLHAATAEDFEALLALRLRAMRPSLERLGRCDEQRIRDGLARGFEPEHMHHIVAEGRRVGFISLKKLSHAMRLNHLYCFDGAAGFVQAQARYPEGWTIQLVEVSALQDGRVVSVVRVDHPPRMFFATSFFHLEDGLIFAVDEYWSTVEEPPTWRSEAAIAGWRRMRPEDDPRAQTP